MQADSVKCQVCDNIILLKCIQIHELMCQAKKNKKNNSKISYIKNSEIKKVYLKEEQQSDLIPCNDCGQSIPFALYADHQQNTCIGRQFQNCYKCGTKYPNYLMDEHITICEGNWQPNEIGEQPQNNDKKQYSNNSSLSQGHSYQQDNLYGSQEEEEQPQELNLQEPLLMLIGNLAIQNQQQELVGLTKDQLNNLKNYKGYINEDCSICCVNMSTNKLNVKLKCNHIFHRICIESWLVKNPKCPMCRKHALMF